MAQTTKLERNTNIKMPNIIFLCLKPVRDNNHQITPERVIVGFEPYQNVRINTYERERFKLLPFRVFFNQHFVQIYILSRS